MAGNERLKKLLQMLSEEPRDVFLNYAVALEYLKDPNTIDKAEYQFLNVIDQDKNYLAAYYQLGKLYESKKDFVAAKTYFETGRLRSLEQKNTKSASEFGEALFMLED
jgi:Tfp pilus assembly protein PilF